MLAFGYRWARQHDLAIAEARKAQACNPNDAWAFGMVGFMIDLAGQHRQGAEIAERAMALNPRDPRAKLYPAVIGRAYLVERDYATAEVWARRAVEADSTNPRSHVLLACVLGHRGQKSDAADALETAERLRPGFAAHWLAGREYRNDADNEHLAEGLKKAGSKLK